jgi:hypothetical protein
LLDSPDAAVPGGTGAAATRREHGTIVNAPLAAEDGSAIHLGLPELDPAAADKRSARN